MDRQDGSGETLFAAVIQSSTVATSLRYLWLICQKKAESKQKSTKITLISESCLMSEKISLTGT